MKLRTQFFAMIAAAVALAMSSPPPKQAQEKPAPPAALPNLAVPKDARPFVLNPSAGGIKIDPEKGELDPYTTITVLFPTDMVSPDKIDLEGGESPIVTWPDLDATFVWRTQSQGDWTIKGSRIPGQTYRLRLRENLSDVEGKALPVTDWGAEFSTPPLTVSSWYDERDALSSQPQVSLEFNYLIRLADAAPTVWFQDRATRKKFPAEILLNRADGDRSETVVDIPAKDVEAPMEFRARPLQPLPVNATYDLVVEGTRDAYAGRTLEYPRVFPLGTTKSLSVDYVAARNWPTDKPYVEIKFSVPLAESDMPPNAITFAPPVKNLSFRKEGQTVDVTGEFDLSQRYKVSISQKVVGDRGYPLAEPSLWGATFPPKNPALLFPPGEIRQRSALGLRFALLPVNTGPVTLSLNKIPNEKLPAIVQMVSLSPKDGDVLFSEKFALDRVTTVWLPPPEKDAEVVQKIEWKPEGSQSLNGPYLLEAFAETEGGGRIANRSLIYFSEYLLTQKVSPDAVWVRVAAMGTGKPVAGVTVQTVTRGMVGIATAKTGEDGIATLPRTALAGAEYFVAATPGGSLTLPVDGFASFRSGTLSQSPIPVWLGNIFTDRPLYRPGQEVKFKGYLRSNDHGQLKVPSGTKIQWEVSSADRDELAASGTTTINAFGGWDAAWDVPKEGKLGEYRVRCKLDDQFVGENANFSIEEFRNPAFSVVCSENEAEKAAVSTITVSSQYFHGAPNVGSLVKWTATWISDHDGDYYYDSESDGFKQVDIYSEHAKAPVYEMEVSGETALGPEGTATLISECPFKDPGNREHCEVIWQADVTGPDGQTITGGVTQIVKMNDVSLGVRADGTSGSKDISFDIRAVLRADSITPPEKVHAELFLVQTKSVKERLAPNVYRYRNTDVYTRVQNSDVPANGRLTFAPKEPGRYVFVVSPLSGSSGISVSDDIFLAGPGEAEVPVRSDESLQVELISPKTQDKTNEPVAVGTNASFRILSPSQGLAWVTVETDRVLDTMTLPIEGNSSRIEIPIKEGYAPNAVVSVYLLRPGRDDSIPGEMFGYSAFNVATPSSKLDITIQTEKAEYQPREKVSGSATVTIDNQPVANAELALYAVDDSILELGDWTRPSLGGAFALSNPFSVVTYMALRGFVEKIGEESLTQKGYTVGGGGKDEFGNVQFARKDFRPLILWMPSVKTDDKGNAKFSCEAPDNLTRFRVVAVGQTKSNQFGAGDTTFNVTKNLMIEPALPRFLRDGDEVELRAVALQKTADNETLSVKCAVEGGLSLLGASDAEVNAARAQPVVVKFKAKASGTEAVVKFDTASKTDSKLTDSVEVTLPVKSCSIFVSESVAGAWSGAEFMTGNFAPAEWRNATGTFNLSLSTSSYLSKLLGIPMVLEYPHGCFEQKSSRLLVYTALGKLLALVPESPERKVNYQRIIGESLEEVNNSLLPDGMVPYWPFGTEGNPYVTIQTAWAVAQAIEGGFDVPERVASELPNTLDRMVQRKSRVSVPPTLRAFALFVLSQFDAEISEETSAAAEEMCVNRDRLTAEGRAMLAVALHEFGILPEWQERLVAELPKEKQSGDFDRQTFSSPTRVDAISTWARILVTPEADTPLITKRLETLMESSSSLSTQENLWLLVAFNAMISEKPPQKLPSAVAPKPSASSPDGSAAAWDRRDIREIEKFTIRNLGKNTTGSFMLSARRLLTPSEQEPVSRGLRLERVVKNLTAPTRNGSEKTPFKLGDQVLISYRFYADKPQSYVAVEDALPAGLEVVNPNLAMFGKYYSIPDEPGFRAAWLSYSEMHDAQTNLYFDDFPAGAQGYSVLARVTAAGRFAWPPAQMAPMYDSRFYARTAPTECFVVSE